MSDHGTLYGIGVGPGDPELLTLKAVAVLNSVGCVFAAGSTQNTHSISWEIAQPHIKTTTDMVRLSFPMSKGRERRRQAYEEGAAKIIEFLATGRDAAFLTLGDPLTYSTFIYLSRAVLAEYPKARVEVVPGITSYQVAAANMGWPLVEAEESLMIVSGARGGERLRVAAGLVENIVIVKAYRQFEKIKETLQELGLLDRAILVSRAGLTREKFVCNLADQTEPPPYLSLILVKTDLRKDG